MVPKTYVTTDVYILNSNHLVEYEVCKSNIGHKLNGSKCCKKRLQGGWGGREKKNEIRKKWNRKSTTNTEATSSKHCKE